MNAKTFLAVNLIAWLGLAGAARADGPTTRPTAAAATADDQIPLPLVLPKPRFEGTPKNLPPDVRLDKSHANQPRPPFLVPKGIINVALHKLVTSSDDNPILGDLDQVTDGDKEGVDGSFIELDSGPQWVQIDLQAEEKIYAIVVWHRHNDQRVYRQVVVQVSDDANFKKDVVTLFNNDHDNVEHQGVGQDYEYVDSAEGKLVDARQTTARYVRLWSNGNTADDQNHYTEVEVWGASGQVKQAIPIVAILLLAVAALLWRLPGLDRRPMHADEGRNAYTLGQLLQTHTYRYDPAEFHGPGLFYLSVPIAWLRGQFDPASLDDTTVRLVAVAAGTGLILLLLLTMDALGRTAAVAAGMFCLLSPAMGFYGRDYIHEMPLVLFTFAAMATAWRYACRPGLGWAILCGVSIGLMHATKETCILAIGCAMAAWGIQRFFLKQDAPTPALPRSTRGGGRGGKGGLLHLVAGVLAGAGVSVVLFSAFFTNAHGPLDSILTYAFYFHRGTGTGEAASMHVHPWHYYLHLLLYNHLAPGPVWTEAMIVVLAVIGGCAGFFGIGLGDGHRGFIRFLAIYTLLIFAVYSVIPYKTPWLVLTPLHGMILLAGVGTATLLGWARSLPARAMMGLLIAVGMFHLGVESQRANCRYAADGRNPYVYAQTLPDLANLVQHVEQVATVDPRGHAMLIEVVTDWVWPLPWSLRRFPDVGYPMQIPADSHASVVIASVEAAGPMTDRLRRDYEERTFGFRPGVLLKVYTRKDLWKKLLEEQNK